MTTKQTVYTIGGMDCANCAREVEEGVARLPNVQSVQVDFLTQKMTLQGDVPLETLRGRVEALGKTLDWLAESRTTDQQPARTGVIGFWDYLMARGETRRALIGASVVLLTLVGTAFFGVSAALAGVLYTVGMCITLYPILKNGVNGLLINRTFNINLLMSIAAVGAIIMGDFLEGATVIFLFAVGEALEGYTTDRARNSIRSLVALKPAQATRLQGSHEQIVPVEALQVGDLIVVKPGEAIPMDGLVREGSSSVNQAQITGESLPVAKSRDAGVYAGTLNGEGALQIEVTRLAADNTLSRIIQMVEQAQSVRAPSQRMVDRFAAWYTPAVVLLAAGVAVIPPLLFGAPFYDTPDAHGWLYRALSMLVIACPCSLVISTPVTVISAITAAARRGVLIKGGAHLEALGLVRAVAFDKTGTLTHGTPAVITVRSVDCATGEVCDRCDDVLALASAVERRTTHPLAKAIVAAADAQGLQDRYAAAEAVEMLAGRGVRGTVNGQTVTVGSHGFFDADYAHPDSLHRAVQEAESHGQTTMLIARNQDVLGYIALSDQPRPTSQSVIADLNRMGITTIMLTGDNANAARVVAGQVGVSDVRAGLLPADKVDAVQRLKETYGVVAMVGDGVNDTPALAAATVGIAMGGAGSPLALETAHIALMADDLTQLPFAIRLARFARRVIRQNVALSFGVKAIFLLLALVGVTSLWSAILADVGVLLVVVFNGMRPLATE